MSIPHVHILTNARHTTGASGLGVQAQVQRRPAATHPEVPSPTSTSSSPMSDQPSVTNMYDTYVTCEHDFPKVGEMIKTWESVGKSGHRHTADVGFGGKGVGKGGDRFVGKSGVLQGIGGKRVRFDEGKGLFEDDVSFS